MCWWEFCHCNITSSLVSHQAVLCSLLPVISCGKLSQIPMVVPLPESKNRTNENSLVFTSTPATKNCLVPKSVIHLHGKGCYCWITVQTSGPRWVSSRGLSRKKISAFNFCCTGTEVTVLFSPWPPVQLNNCTSTNSEVLLNLQQ